MKTSTVVLSSIIAAGASGVAARPFFGNPADLSISSLLGRSEPAPQGNKPDDHTAHIIHNANKDTLAIAGDSHLKVKVADNRGDVKPQVKAGVCLDVTIDGVLTQDCKDEKKPAPHHTTDGKDHGKICHTDKEILDLQVKFNAILQQNHKLQGVLTDYKHKIVDYEHKLATLEAEEPKNEQKHTQALHARSTHESDHRSSSSSDFDLHHDSTHDKHDSSSYHDGHHTDDHSSHSSSSTDFGYEHHDEHDSESHTTHKSQPAKGKPEHHDNAPKPKSKAPNKGSNKPTQHHNKHEEGGYRTGKDIKQDLHHDGKVLKQDLRETDKDLHHDFHHGEKEFKQGKTYKVMEKDGKVVKQDLKSGGKAMAADYHRDEKHFDSQYKKDAKAFDSNGKAFENKLKAGGDKLGNDIHHDENHVNHDTLPLKSDIKAVDAKLKTAGKDLGGNLKSGGKTFAQDYHEDAQHFGSDYNRDAKSFDSNFHDEANAFDKEYHRDGKNFDSEFHRDGKNFDKELHRDGKNFDSKAHQDGSSFKTEKHHDAKEFEAAKQRDGEQLEQGMDKETHDLGLGEILRRGSMESSYHSGSASFHGEEHDSYDYQYHSYSSDVDDDLHHDGKKVDYTMHHDGKMVDKDAHKAGNLKHDEHEMYKGGKQLDQDVKTLEDHLYLNKVAKQANGLLGDAGKDGKKAGGDVKHSSTTHGAHDDIHDDDKQFKGSKGYKGGEKDLRGVEKDVL